MLKNSLLLSCCFLRLILKPKLTKGLVLAGTMSLLFACQTGLNIAGNNHQLVGAKWKALSVYAQSELVKYGITISAKLVVVRNSETEEFRLRKIKFSYSADVFNVDLLTPVFAQKYICDPECYQLLEYKSGNGQSGETMLTHFFNQHEFELFQFYADLVLLSEQLDMVDESRGALLTYYLKSLTDDKYTFESTEDFISFLKDALSEESMYSFINDPSSQDTSFLKNYAVTPRSDWYIEPDVILDPQSTTTKNNKIKIIKEDELWLAVDMVSPEDVLFQNIVNVEEDIGDSWQSAKLLPIKIGNNVCSYDNNLFGIVKSITNQDVVVELLGQGKILSDGVLQGLPRGGLFSSHKGFSFIPRVDTITLSIRDIATCYLE